MVHNGIEYGDMQLICEAYFMLQGSSGGLTNDELYDVFDEWNRGELQSYLIEITRDIFSVKDDQGGDGYLVDKILDVAGAKGTGKWMSQLALDLGVPSTLVTDGRLCPRPVGAERGPRAGQQGARWPAGRESDDGAAELSATGKPFIEAVRQALVRLEDLQLRPGLRATAGRGRGARLAAELRRSVPCCGAAAASFAPSSSTASRKRSTHDRNLENLLLHPVLHRSGRERPKPPGAQWCRRHALGLPVPAFSTALAYYDGYRRARLPANLLQAQRDYFGAHTYQRIDKEGHVPHRMAR